MNDLRLFNDEMEELYEFDSKTVSDFPPFFYYRYSILFNYKRINAGIIISSQSTGSRVSSHDYSGDYHFDMIVKSKSHGIYLDVIFLEMNPLSFTIYSIAGIIYTNLNFNEALTIWDTPAFDNEYEFISTNLFYEPGLSTSISYKSFSLSLKVGYLLQFGSQVFKDPDNDMIILYPPVTSTSSTAVKPGWDGLRVGLSLSYTLSFRKHNQKQE